ncbi:hypothetical protein SAMN05192561_11232 [Halopenitus malekzadehii]|uniref:Uncharacterized protein n=1 Tax=Halopenitus malekzadehii TaxID=1267564 RepID=A0A1H6JJN7_9EURY|nr:hypothetical protein [Halopenitus malekzadehii]SEH60719.1 hypothetical protein SAMN05192561_11232 [Halopenitus malekzadehii]
MSNDTSAREEINAVIRRHESDLDPDDLREIAHDLETTAERWEGIAL